MRLPEILLVLGALTLAGWRWRGGAWRPRWLARLLLFGVALLGLGVWMVPAVPTLPLPDGPYAVGTRIARWTDVSRDEPHTVDGTDRRSVIAQAWYPIPRGMARSSGARVPYLDGIDSLPAQVSGLPSVLMRRYDRIDSHATADAPLAPHARPWPVVIFLPGYGAPRAVYTGLVTQLASRGFVVITVDHPYEAAVTQLPDGRVVRTIETRQPGERDRIGYMTREQARRVADVRFVLDQLARTSVRASLLRGGVIDAARVAVVGHSFGGAAAAAALHEDARVAAAVNIDGTPYGDLPARVLTRPFLLVQSDSAETHHGAFFVNGNGRLLAHMTAPGYRYAIARTNHFSFSDAPFFLAPPARWLAAQLIGGARGPAATQRITAELVAAFLEAPLTGAGRDLGAAAHNLGVVGGRMSPAAPVSAAPVSAAPVSAAPELAR